MTTFYSITGVILIILLLAIVLAGLIAWLVDGINKTRWDRWMEKKAKAAREIGQEITCASHWFSEHAPTSALVMSIGKCYFERGDFQVQEIREAWRKILPPQHSGEKTTQRIGEQIRQSGRLFEQDPPTQWLLMAIGMSYYDGGDPKMGAILEEWKKLLPIRIPKEGTRADGGEAEAMLKTIPGRK